MSASFAITINHLNYAELIPTSTSEAQGDTELFYTNIRILERLSRVAAAFSKPQRPPNAVTNLFIVLFSAVTPHLCRVDIGRTLIVRLGQKVHDRK